MRQLPKALREPVGTTLVDEPEAVKALRLLRSLRHFAHGKQYTLGMTLDGVQIMLIRYRPKPEGPHPVGADISGVDL